MISFAEVIVLPLFPRIIFIQWEVENNLYVGDIKFDILKGHSPGGPFDKVNHLPQINTFFYKDRYETPLSKLYDVYYKIVGTDQLGEKFESEPTNLFPKQDDVNFCYSQLDIATEITRREKLLLERFTGVPCTVLKRKHFGSRCSECYNFVTEEVTYSDCKECFGTGFLDGYYTPIKVRLQFDPAIRQQVTTDRLATKEDISTSAWTINVPVLKKADIVVEDRTNKRWHVHEVQLTELQHTPVRQIMRLREIEHGNPAYDVPITPAVDLE